MRSLSVIAVEVYHDWGLRLYYGARPYLQAMAMMETMSDHFGEDEAASMVAYFLANATRWQGATARRIKTELRGMLQQHAKGLP